MSPPPRGPVVADTGVFGATLVPSIKSKQLASRYRADLEGRKFVIPFVTVAELHFGTKRDNWGEKRLNRLNYEITRSEVVWPGPALVDTYTALRAWCVKTGHGLGQKDHEADRWVATTAVHLGIPLVAHDSIFFNVKDLQLITKLPKLDRHPDSSQG